MQFHLLHPDTITGGQAQTKHHSNRTCLAVWSRLRSQKVAQDTATYRNTRTDAKKRVRKGLQGASTALGQQWTTVRAIIYKWRNIPSSGQPSGQQCIQQVTKEHGKTSEEMQASFASAKVNIHDSTTRKTLGKKNWVEHSGGSGTVKVLTWIWLQWRNVFCCCFSCFFYFKLYDAFSVLLKGATCNCQTLPIPMDIFWPHGPDPPTNTAPSSLSVYSECVSWSRQSFVFVVIPYFLLGLYCTFLKFTFELILFCYLATQNVTNRLASSLRTISSDICAQLVCKLHSQIWSAKECS